MQVHCKAMQAGFYGKAFLFWAALSSSQYLLALVWDTNQRHKLLLLHPDREDDGLRGVALQGSTRLLFFPAREHDMSGD